MTVRARDDLPAPGETTRLSVVPLDRSAIASDYLRITYSISSCLLAPIAVCRTTLGMRENRPSATVPIEGRAPAPTGTRVIDFATPIVSMRVLAARGDGVISVRVLRREDRQQPWTLLGTGLATDGSARASDWVSIRHAPSASRQTPAPEVLHRSDAPLLPDTTRCGFPGERNGAAHLGRRPDRHERPVSCTRRSGGRAGQAGLGARIAGVTDAIDAAPVRRRQRLVSQCHLVDGVGSSDGIAGRHRLATMAPAIARLGR